MANLQLKSLSKIYPSGALALYKINLQLADSEFVAVIGGEKSGKTTLLRLVAGLDDCSEGEIIVGGTDVTGVPSRDRDLAMIFQGSSLYPSLNVYENMAYGLRMRKQADAVIEQRVKAAAEILGLTEVLYRKPKALTAEQKQKVAFARAIVREPKIYLLDDPLGGMSADVKERLRSVLINLQIRMKGTFVYATKNVNEALTMATRMVILREGFLQQVDTPANLYDYPANAFVAFTLGSPTINFLNGSVIEKDGDNVYAVCGGLKLCLPENIVKRFASLEEYAGTGKKVILGLRPEDIRGFEAEGKEAENDWSFEGKITAAEEICGVRYADCTVGKLNIGVTSPHGEKGDTVKLTADMTRAYLFDADTRLTLLERDGGYAETDCEDAKFKPLTYGEEEELKKKFGLGKVEKKKK